MKRISRRGWAIWLLILILLGGTALFVAEFAAKSGQWAMYPGNPHIYEAGKQTPAKGTVVDREGALLLQFGEGRSYSTNSLVRQSTMHWLGDRKGYIYAPMLQAYAEKMTVYDPISGAYDYSGQGGQAVLTLSSKVQQVALEAMGDHRGTIAVYNYKTGEILCAVTTPTYDPDAVPDIEGDETGEYDGVYVNRFTQSLFIPGSIFKIATTAAALEALEDIQTQTFTCTGTEEYGIDKVTCVEPHGTMDLKRAMLLSCNCAYAQLAQRLGAETLEHYIEKFGVLERVSFDGVTSAQGHIDLEQAAPVELAWTAIGQHEDQINPCSYLAFVGAVANGGQGVQPYVVQSVTAGGKTTYTAQPQLSQRIMSQETAAVLLDFMRNNVELYYGDEHFPGLRVCAKSGTAEVGPELTPNAMFTGFALDTEYPLAFIVAIENGGYGQTTCMPILTPVLGACMDVLEGK